MGSCEMADWELRHFGTFNRQVVPIVASLAAGLESIDDILDFDDQRPFLVDLLIVD